MALMPYRMARAAFAAGAGYQGYLQALPVLEIASGRAPPDPEGTGATSRLARRAWQLVLTCLAILCAGSPAMQTLAGIYCAVCTATRLVSRTGSLACRVARWPAHLPQLAPAASWPMPGRFCCICGKFARLPFPTCDYCWDTPSYHHGRCCPWKPADGREGLTTEQNPSNSCRLECTKVCRAQRCWQKLSYMNTVHRQDTRAGMLTEVAVAAGSSDFSTCALIALS